jgi:hypothetical protein
MRVALPLVIALTACSIKMTPTISSSGPTMLGTPGKNGKIGFLYGGLATTCDLCPMMPGTTERVNITPGQAPDTIFESSDPSVFSVEPGGEEYEGSDDGGITALLAKHVRAVAPGTAELRITSRDGAILDRVDLVVEVPARVALVAASADAGAAETTSASLSVGASLGLTAHAFRADGTPIEAQGGWTFASDDPTVVEVTDACGFICFTGEATLKATARAAGTANAGATGAGVSGRARITVTK